MYPDGTQRDVATDTDTALQHRLRVTDERIVELLLATVLTLVVIVAISWAVEGYYSADGSLHFLGTLAGFALAVAIYHRHPAGLVGGLLYFGVVVGDVLVGWSGLEAPLGLAGAVAVALLGGGTLLLCRGSFLDGT